MVDAEQTTEAAGLASRRAAIDVLALVRQGATFDEALGRCRSFGALTGSDRGFAHALAATVLRRRGSLDHVIGAFIDRPLPGKAARVMDILRLTAAQSAILETPDHAAVSTSVALAKAFRETEGYAGLVNAVARKIARTGKATIKTLPARTDTPGWLWRSWERAYGPAVARAIAAAHQQEPPLDLTMRDPADAEAVAREMGGEVLPTGGVRMEGARDVTGLSGFAEGAWWVQDAAASLPAKLCGEVAGKRVFDLCAAPGGKTLQLAAEGAQVTSVDVAGPRLKLLAENLSRVGVQAETVKADLLTWAPPEKADVVLLDAPCSATGTIRRRPDIAWAKTPDDVAALARLQTQMIDRAIEHCLRPGGLLVYAVCSLQPEEGERQIEAALERRPELAREPVSAAEIGGVAEVINRHGDLRTLPSHWSARGGMDGFFAARLRFRG